jgi:ATP-dependent Clp protease ATP-binding subunit ClpC
MKLSASIELVMQFATYEAMAGQFGEVEPEHLLMALLKLAELPTAGIEELSGGPGRVQELAKEVSVVCKEVSRRGIDAKKVRRELRTNMGKGNSPFSGGQVHRSAAARQVFDVAGKLADDTGEEAIKAEHILEALMIAPTPRIEQILGDAIGAKVAEHKNTPTLDEYGRNLTKLAAERGLPSVSNREAETKVLLEALKRPEHRNILLINSNDKVVESVVISLSHSLADRKGPPELKNIQLIDVTKASSSHRWDRHTRERLEKIFSEASSLENVILFVPPIELPAGKDFSRDWPGFLLKALSKGSINCLCRVEPRTYTNYMTKEPVWKRLAEFIWIRDEVKKSVPVEL